VYSRALVGLMVLWLAAGAHAQTLGDPTRPPAGQRGGGGPGRQAGDPAGLVLESVIISDAARSAIISGEHVMLGGKIGQARLVQVSEVAVVLLTGDSRRTLKLFPGVHKRPAGEPASIEDKP
jgi:MSHA biogenesis protein MshK